MLLVKYICIYFEYMLYFFCFYIFYLDIFNKFIMMMIGFGKEKMEYRIGSCIIVYVYILYIIRYFIIDF